MLPHDEAMYGAAYQVLFERLDPHGCVDREKAAAGEVTVSRIRRWIATQPDDVARAYDRALGDIAKLASGTLENNERAAQMRALRADLPIPPVGE